MLDPALMVLIGTKAQFIKTAPVLRELDARNIAYRLVYTGQHSETFDALEAAFGTRPPDDVLVPDFSKEPLMTSGLLVSSLPGPSSPDVLTPQRDPVSEKLLGAPPTSRRTFARAETLAWMAEIYDNSLPKQPKQIDVSARLIDEAGRDAFASRDLLANGEGGAPKWQTFGYTGRIPLKDIAPGRYLLRIEAQDRSAASRQPAAAQTVITVR